MTEKRFLSFVLTEGILLMMLGVGMLLLPKVTSITFGIMICMEFIIYGGYKALSAFMARNYSKHYILNVLSGLLLTIMGGVLFFSPMLNLIIFTSLVGIYFLIESVASFAFALQAKNVLNFWWVYLAVPVLEFFIGLIIVLGLPTTSLWVIGVMAGINFLIAGALLVCMYWATTYSK